MKNILNKTLIAAIAASMAACTGNYEEINSEPYTPGDLTADDYALGSALNNIAGSVVSAEVNKAQFTDCLLGGPLGGYFSPAKQGWANSIQTYDPTDDWTKVFMIDVPPTLYSNLTMVKNFCEVSGTPVPDAIATIMKVAAMHRVTDTYGPIPYSAIENGGDLNTYYDPVDKIYDAFFRDLTEAVTILNDNRGAALSPTADFVYRGDVNKWIRLANSLKLRLAIRIAYADLEKAKAMAEEAVDPANGGVIELNSDNAAWNYFATMENPLYTAVNYNANGSTTGGDTHAAADIICYMNGYNDPRRSAYFSESLWTDEDNNKIQYVGQRRGIRNPTYNTEWGFNFSGVKISPSDPIKWLNAAEVAFLRAEGIAIFGFDLGGTAEQFYNEGIRLSFEQYGVSGAEEYIVNNSSRPQAYVDPSGMNPWNGSLSTITIKWDDNATKEEKQERIITQKWIANWMIGNEAWADLRRTGYPRLMPIAYNGSGGLLNSDQTPARMKYPEQEYTNNAANVSHAVAAYLNGPDNMATRIWWDCKNK